ncbi:MAG: hypothetical protein IKT45_10470 [Lachnospiraceae bacterium]|nr:hypothetical protein [Lachnospiraceae bacterium]
MKAGKAFELLVKYILMHIGFSEVVSDGLYVFNGTSGQMIQGLGDAHNADVLLEPPVQTPFYTPTRLLIECKDQFSAVGLNVVRSALGLREDINHFDIVDVNELRARRSNRRRGIVHKHSRYMYQVAVASMSGFTVPAQNFAITHRIPLIEFDKMPFWSGFKELIDGEQRYDLPWRKYDEANEEAIKDFADQTAERFAVAITNSGQMLFLYRTNGRNTEFEEKYMLYWDRKDEPWRLVSGNVQYRFQLPEYILKQWLENSSNDLDMKINAINCKTNYLSNMIVYYSEYGCPQIKMISIDRSQLRETLIRLKQNR